MTKQAFPLTPSFRERVWGRRNLQPFFDTPFENPIGEVWFQCDSDPRDFGTASDPRHPGVCPLLVKLLFTSERLSVQVHPDDEYAERHHQGRGKTEAWYVLDSQPPGEVAVGFKKPLTREELTEAAHSGEIENLLDWRKVKPGDLIFTPAGTVHAIGAGVTICEIQQNSDITYRLYDYGRPRELHLEHGVEVSRLGPHTFESKPFTLDKGREQLVAGKYFRIERLRPETSLIIPEDSPYFLILIGANGDVWFIPAHNSEFTVESAQEWLLTYQSEMPAQVRLS